MTVELSIICPTYNEAKHIEGLTQSLNSPDGLQKEIIYVDGGSTDGTREKILALQKQFGNVVLVDNPERYVSKGFNKAFEDSKGSFIAFVGAHARYSEDYFSRGVNYLKQDECDVVGGYLVQQGRTETGQAIAYCMSSRFGVGGTEFRTERKRMFVQTVAFAIYKRKVFETCGLMDEDLIVNQDDEFHYRLSRYGYRILMTPDMSATYYVRDSLSALSKQYFRYGLYKPLVLKKVSSGFKLRHAIPALFFLYLISMPVSLVFMWWAIPLVLYVLLDLLFSLRTRLSAKSKGYSFLAFPVLHISSGIGLLLGLFKL
jgi:GT2 family glycosyltransferase